MVTRKVLRQALGASAAVVLAAVVNAAIATPAVALTLAPEATHRATLAGDLSWAISGATTAAQSTRSLLAEKAAQAIHSLDRLCGAEGTPYVAVCMAADARRSTASNFYPAVPTHTDSSHQHSAP